ncbi:MAG: pyridoxal phosphate-dependent aminotransferase [Clostridia bacterium]
MKSIREKMDPKFAVLKGGLFDNFKRLEDSGVLLMGWADPFAPDPAIPEHIKEATIKAIMEGNSHYTLPTGDFRLREAIAKKLKDYNGLKVNPNKEIIVTPGSDTGLYYAMRPFIDPKKEDEVLIPDPSYPSNFRNVELMGGIPVRVPLKEEKGYQLEIEEFRKRATPNTKMILLTNPNNPTTTVLGRKSLEDLAAFTIEKDLVVVVDQAFEDIIYDSREFVALASLEGMWERTVTVFSISKGMGLSGYRIGYNVACEEAMDVFYGGAVNILGAANTAATAGAIAGFEDYSFIEEYKKIYDRRRKRAFEVFNSIPGVSCLMPESGFLAWVNISKLGSSSEIAQYLIEDAKVGVNPGNEYGERGEGYFRIVLGTFKEDEKFLCALDRIKVSLTKLAREKGTK